MTRAQAEIPVYATLPLATLTGPTENLVSRLLAALSVGAMSPEDVRALREYGETRARQGVSLSDVQSGWRIAVRETLSELTTVARAARISDRTLLEITHELLDVVDQATMAYSGGHRDVEIDMALHDQQMRADFARGLLLGTLGPAEIGRRAQHYGLDPDAEYLAVRARAQDESAAAEIRRLLGVGRVRGLSATIDGDLAAFVSAFPRPGLEGVLAVGPAAGLEALPRSFRLAGRMLATAHLFGLTGVADLDRLGVLPAVAVDPDLGAELTRRYLDPLGSGESARVVIDTVERYLDTGMRIEATAEHLVVHPNTVRYRLTRFAELTGADLRAPHIAVRVWWAIQRRRAEAAKGTARDDR
ncbi:PucR family transcriptional regulator [Nocardia jejuensis]|uniref:PucR family transcriptional regulator n=1 Tax=Nocardia jejuensis TaxID=328049 RepID=UPI000A480B37|nr:helix-turn-helix domain-containing protein [Nocardia jejuensis]